MVSNPTMVPFPVEENAASIPRAVTEATVTTMMRARAKIVGSLVRTFRKLLNLNSRHDS